MSEEPDLSDLILRAFLLRHARLTNLGSGPVLVGSRFDADTRRLLEVFARNRLSSRWMELEGSPEPRRSFASSTFRSPSCRS
jgi:thioredoxin reductase (NADPH)